MENIKDSLNDCEFEVLTQEDLEAEMFVDEIENHFETVLNEISLIHNNHKSLEYCNDEYSIYKIEKIDDASKEGIALFEVYDKNEKKSVFHYIKNKRLEPQFLLSLINRSEIIANRKK